MRKTQYLTRSSTGEKKSPVEKLLLFTQKQNKTRRTDEREKKFREKPKLKF